MAEAADAEAMRKQMAEMKKELEMMRRIIQIQNSQVQVHWIFYIGIPKQAADQLPLLVCACVRAGWPRTHNSQQ